MTMNAMQTMPLTYSFQTLCYLNDSRNSSFTQKAEVCQNRKGNAHVVSSEIPLLAQVVTTLIYQHLRHHTP